MGLPLGPTPPMAWVSTSFLASFATSRSTVGTKTSSLTQFRSKARRTRYLTSMTANPASNEDAYRQFGDLLNKNVPPEEQLPLPNQPSHPQAPADQSPSGGQQDTSTEADNKLKEKYAEFAERLGIEDDIKSPGKPHERDTIEKATPQKVAIDPADYSVFDSLLKRSGGTGNKSMKGSKRYASLSPPSSGSTPTTPTPPTPTMSPKPPMPPTSASATPKDATPPPPSQAPTFSPEDAADGYAVLAEQFGIGFHDAVDRTTAPEKPLSVGRAREPAADAPTLKKPPPRPSDLSASQATVRAPENLFDSSIPVPHAEPPVEPLLDAPVLQPKPAMPRDAESADDVETVHSKMDSHTSAEQLVPEAPPAVLTPKPELRDKPQRPSPTPAPTSGGITENDAPVSEKLPSRVTIDGEQKTLIDETEEEYVENVDLDSFEDLVNDVLGDDDRFVVGIDDTDGFTTIEDGLPATDGVGLAEVKDGSEKSVSQALQEKPERKFVMKERSQRNIRSTRRRESVEKRMPQSMGPLVLKNPRLILSSETQ